MPLQFRCGHCNGLLGIAKRKAGSIIHCPLCRKTVVVPKSEAEGEIAKPAPEGAVSAPPPPKPAPLLEGSLIANLLEASDADRAALAKIPLTTPAPSPVVLASPLELPVIDVEPVDEPHWRGGIVLSKAKLTIAAVALVLLLATAFFIGLLVGKKAATIGKAEESRRSLICAASTVAGVAADVPALARPCA